MKSLFGAVALSVCLSAFAAEEHVITVNAGDPMRTLTDSDVAALGTDNALVKRGSGWLKIDVDLSAARWKGKLDIREGYVLLSHAGGLGLSTAQGAYVSGTGTLALDGNVFTGEAYPGCDKVYLEGTGANGEGALIAHEKAVSVKYLEITLTDDAAIGGSASKGLTLAGGGRANLDLNGHTATLNGNGTKNGIHFFMSGDRLVGSGHLVVDRGLQFISETTKYLGGASNTLTFKTSGQWRVANATKENCTWKIILEKDVYLNLTAASWSTKESFSLGWSGPVEIKAGAKLEWAPGAANAIYYSLSGPVAGAGTLSCVNQKLQLENPSNDIATVANSQGEVIACSLGSVMPAFRNGDCYTMYSAATNTITVQAEEAWPVGAALQKFMSAYGTAGTFQRNTGRTILNLPDSLTLDDGTVTGFSDVNLPEGTRTYVVGTTLAAASQVRVHKAGTTLSVEGEGPHALDAVYQAAGKVVFDGCGEVDATVARYYCGATYPAVAELVVRDGARIVSKVDGVVGSAGKDNGILVGRNPNDAGVAARGIVRLEAGGAISNRVASLDKTFSASTHNVQSMGSFFVDGGDFYYHNSDFQYGVIGNGIGGYAKLGSGRWTSDSWFTVGHNATGRGVFEALGGTLRHATGAIGIGGYGAMGHAYFGGDVAATVNLLDLGFSTWGSGDNTPGAWAAVTVADRATVTFSQLRMGLCSDSTSIINLCGGTVTMPALYGEYYASHDFNDNSSQAYYEIENCTAYLNLNGGTIRPAWNSSLFSTPSYLKPILYAGGVDIDLTLPSGEAGAHSLSVDIPVASGKGVGSVPVPSDVPWEYTGAPFVRIVGDGEAATAFAQFDSENGLVTNVVVTSPGRDYTWARAIFERGGATSDVELDLTDRLVDNMPTGHVRFCGKGVITLSGNNQGRPYAGPTCVGEGVTVNVWSPNWHYSTQSPLKMEGGTIVLGSSGSLGWMNLSWIGGWGVAKAHNFATGTLRFDAADIAAGRILDLRVNAAVQLTKGAKVTIDGLDALSLANAPYTLVTAKDAAGESAATFTSASTPLLDAGNAQSAALWKVRVVGNALELQRVKPLFLMLR